MCLVTTTATEGTETLGQVGAVTQKWKRGGGGPEGEAVEMSGILIEKRSHNRSQHPQTVWKEQEGAPKPSQGKQYSSRRRTGGAVLTAD